MPSIKRSAHSSVTKGLPEAKNFSTLLLVELSRATGPGKNGRFHLTLFHRVQNALRSCSYLRYISTASLINPTHILHVHTPTLFPRVMHRTIFRGMIHGDTSNGCFCSCIREGDKEATACVSLRLLSRGKYIRRPTTNCAETNERWHIRGYDLSLRNKEPNNYRIIAVSVLSWFRCGRRGHPCELIIKTLHYAFTELCNDVSSPRVSVCVCICAWVTVN